MELRPLPIAKLRKFVRKWAEHSDAMARKYKEIDDFKGDDDESYEQAKKLLNGINDAQFDVFIELCSLSLGSQLKGERTEKQFASYLEDVLDTATIHHILDKCGGLKLGDNQDPNQKGQVTTGLADGTS